MFHYHIQICFVGPRKELWTPIKDEQAPEGFTCTCLESARAEDAPLERADLILADIQALGAQALGPLLSGRREDAGLVVLSGGEQFPLLSPHLGQIADIWTLPMSGEELRFRFRRRLDGLRAEREIQRGKEVADVFSSFLANDVDDVYMMFNGTGDQLEYASPNMERVLGITREEAAQHGIGRMGQAQYITGHAVGREELLQMEPGSTFGVMETERVDPKTGERRWFYESIYCVSVQGVKKIAYYISDRTKEHQAQRTLSEALDMAQVASKAKSAFLSSVSHDIRTPMNAIMGFVELLREESDNAEQVLEYTQKISAASQHLLGLINDVLDMNKIESGSTVLNIDQLNLAEVIEGLNTIIRPQAKAKDQTFEIFVSALAHEDLLGDKLRINQILINILSNAVKYTPKGGRIELRVMELPQTDSRHDRIRFVVSDNGMGMSEDYQKVIFDPFTREQSTMLNKIQGTGLGMAITKSLVDLMNGSISVTSSPGEGSTFTVELELRIQEEKGTDPRFWEAHGITRMIVADDDEDICRNIVKRMGRLGVETHYAIHGEDALQAISAAREAGRPYDLILLDWKMPGLNGLETARLIRKNYPDKIPILLFTAYDWSDIEQEAMEVGIRHFLPKPFFMSNFKEAVQRMQEGGSAPAQPKEKRSAMKGLHILVVDDIEVNRIILTKILTTLGAECETACDGQEALEKFERSQPGQYDIIFMDVQMPVLNGYEASRAIRASAHPRASQVPIIAMTANAFMDDIRDALEAGMDAHVSKPIVIEQMEAAVQEVLERKGLLSR
ncbi:MAG: response regulator [Clostridiales bacterium]|nr:response regulator [Clostridiales bacterium]